jgi:hypothetical protein
MIGRGREDYIAFALMGALGVIMACVFGQSALEGTLSKQDHM